MKHKLEYKYIDRLYFELNDTFKIMRKEDLEEFYITFENMIFEAVIEKPSNKIFYTVFYDPYLKEDEDIIYVNKFKNLIDNIVIFFENKKKI